MKPPIINRPDLQTLRQRFSYSFLTFLFWLIWFYLWIPLISLGGWLFGIDLFHDEMVVREGLNALAEILGWYLLVVLLISAALGIWATINLFRFRGNGRREARAVIEDKVLAEDYGVTIEQIEAWRDSKRLVIRNDGDGNLEAVDSGNEGASK